MQEGIMTQSQLEMNFKKHIQKEEKIWSELRETIYQKYIKEGYYQWWAEMKADREILELRSMPRNPENMQIPAEQTLQGDLD
jgi:hypothetical protein